MLIFLKLPDVPNVNPFKEIRPFVTLGLVSWYYACFLVGNNHRLIPLSALNNSLDIFKVKVLLLKLSRSMFLIAMKEKYFRTIFVMNLRISPHEYRYICSIHKYSILVLDIFQKTWENEFCFNFLHRLFPFSLFSFLPRISKPDSISWSLNICSCQRSINKINCPASRIYDSFIFPW